MKLESVNNWVTLGANIGVLIGILLLVYELNQNREMMKADIRNSIAQTTATLLHNVALDEDIVEISVKAQAGEVLNSVEDHRFRLYWNGFFRLWENMLYQNRQGLFEESEYMATLSVIKYSLSNNAVWEQWCLNQVKVSEDFANEVDSLFENKPCN